MTRKSKRELERAVAGLGVGDPTTVREWVDVYLETHYPDAESVYTVISADGEVIEEPDHTGKVPIWKGRAEFGPGFWVPEAEIPEWVDREQLPVRG